jgi:hypothetical protein
MRGLAISPRCSIYVLIEVAGAPDHHHPNSEQDANSKDCFHLISLDGRQAANRTRRRRRFGASGSSDRKVAQAAALEDCALPDFDPPYLSKGSIATEPVTASR